MSARSGLRWPWSEPPPRLETLPALLSNPRAAGGVTLAEAAANLQAARRPLTNDERALGRFRARHAGDPLPFARVRS